MKIEKGKQYRTRMGEVATVYDIVENGQNYPVLGSVINKDTGKVEIAAWAIDGSYNLHYKGESPTDLVEYTPDPTQSMEFWSRLESHFGKAIVSSHNYRLIDEYKYFLKICQQKINDLK